MVEYSTRSMCLSLRPSLSSFGILKKWNLENSPKKRSSVLSDNRQQRGSHVREYKKKAAEDAYTPQRNKQTVRIEASLSDTVWKSAENIYQEVNGPGLGTIALYRVRNHLYWHARRKGRLEERE